jgi:hypothetical protein
MSDGPVVAVRDLSQRDSSQLESPERNAALVSSTPGWVEIELTDGGTPISKGTLVGVQTSQTLYVGNVESREILGHGQRLRIRVDHWLDLQDIAIIQKLWSQEEAN